MPADMKKIIAETFLKMIQHKNIEMCIRDSYTDASLPSDSRKLFR